jgi:hypothetical protein
VCSATRIIKWKGAGKAVSQLYIVLSRTPVWLLLGSALLVYANYAHAHDSDSSDAAAGPQFSSTASAIFNRRCTACHTYGKGVKIGPNLKGVNERRTREWLIRFIRTSSQLISLGRQWPSTHGKFVTNFCSL